MKKKICICTTVWSSINNWITPFLSEYNNRGIDVTIVCNMDKDFEEDLKKRFPFVHTYPIEFPRGINFLGSLKSIMIIYSFLKKKKFDLIQYSTPNASLYCSIAAKMAGIPIRLYCQWGMVYITMHGIKKIIFERFERMICCLSTDVQPDSEGNLQFCRKQGFYDDKKSRIIWNGSAKGLDLTAYNIDHKMEYSLEIRKMYGIMKDEPVIGFVGRLGKEKGCNELLLAFKDIKKEFPKAKLLFVGPIEKEDTIDPELLDYFRTNNDIIKTDRVSHVEKYMSAMNIFVLPSYREGFGMSVVEASAMQVPVVVTKYPGPSSAIDDNVSGYSVPVKDVEQLAEKILIFLRDPEIGIKMGIAGRKFVEERFDQKIFIEKYMENRTALLGLNN